MCRFIAYKGKNPLLLKYLLKDPPNSLISQSKRAKDQRISLNADGFGIGWYNRAIDPYPALFKSTQPAWNDDNLQHIASKTLSDCFIGHVRACTVGNVSLPNCHPFAYDRYLFAHNGTIENFNIIKKALFLQIDSEYFLNIKGQTDSETFFHLILNTMKHRKLSIQEAIPEALNILNSILKEHGLHLDYRVSAVMTDGDELVAIRYTTDPENHPLSLNYSCEEGSLIIASEPLDNTHHKWEEIPNNHILHCKGNGCISFHNVVTNRGSNDHKRKERNEEEIKRC